MSHSQRSQRSLRSSSDDKQESLDRTVTEGTRKHLHHLTRQKVQKEKEKAETAKKMKEVRQELEAIDKAIQDILDSMGGDMVGETIDVGEEENVIARLRYVERECKQPLTQKLLKEYFIGLTNGDEQKADFFIEELNNRRGVTKKKRILKL